MWDELLTGQYFGAIKHTERQIGVWGEVFVTSLKKWSRFAPRNSRVAVGCRWPVAGAGTGVGAVYWVSGSDKSDLYQQRCSYEYKHGVGGRFYR